MRIWGLQLQRRDATQEARGPRRGHPILGVAGFWQRLCETLKQEWQSGTARAQGGKQKERDAGTEGMRPEARHASTRDGRSVKDGARPGRSCKSQEGACRVRVRRGHASHRRGLVQYCEL